MILYRYLIGYVSVSNGAVSGGAIDLNRRTPIRSMDDVLEVERELRQHKADPDLVVISFSRYTDPTPGGDRR
jgi:hypothetical protein